MSRQLAHVRFEGVKRTWPDVEGRLRIAPACHSGARIIARSRLQVTTEVVMATNATKVRTALTACEYSHCRRAASKSAGVAVQLSLATFIGYVNNQQIPCVAAKQRNAASERKKAVRSLRTMKVCIKVIRSAAITAMPKKDHPA